MQYGSDEDAQGKVDKAEATRQAMSLGRLLSCEDPDPSSRVPATATRQTVLATLHHLLGHRLASPPSQQHLKSAPPRPLMGPLMGHCGPKSEGHGTGSTMGNRVAVLDHSKANNGQGEKRKRNHRTTSLPSSSKIESNASHTSISSSAAAKPPEPRASLQREASSRSSSRAIMPPGEEHARVRNNKPRGLRSTAVTQRATHRSVTNAHAQSGPLPVPPALHRPPLIEDISNEESSTFTSSARPSAFLYQSSCPLFIGLTTPRQSFDTLSSSATGITPEWSSSRVPGSTASPKPTSSSVSTSDHRHYHQQQHLRLLDALQQQVAGVARIPSDPTFVPPLIPVITTRPSLQTSSLASPRVKPEQSGPEGRKRRSPERTPLYDASLMAEEDDLNKRRRVNQGQLDVLEAAYRDDPLPSRRTKQRLASQLGLSLKRVQIWFQNRRAKQKRRRRGSSASSPTDASYGDVNSSPPSSEASNDQET